VADSSQDLREQIRAYIRTNFLFDPNKPLNDGESLLNAGIIDSTGVLELIGHLESTYGVKFSDADLTAENFDSIDRVVQFLSQKLGR
jgi:acyl carrier protein